ncbi:MAG: SDR family NAD(P)-dependent oxidoreductase [Verrucomicrobia bacterium]|nr:SDR family NAD(P)-dependent oxidoreductase [Verrucomicrobiota bacterium]
MTRSEQPVALITGAAGGLGQPLVRAFVAAGWRVAAGWNRTPFPAGDAQVEPVALDVTRPEAAEQAVEFVVKRWGRLDLLINNAGVAADEIVPRLSESDWQHVLEVNLNGAFRCARAALRPMLRQRDGHILNITSYGGRVGRAGQSNYAASKAALFGLTQSLAREVGSRNIRVNAVSPGFLRTPLVGTLTEEQLAGHAAANVLGRLNEFEEVARFLVFLAGMRNVSGQIFQLDSRITPWS